MMRDRYVFRREWLDYMAELEPAERMEVRDAVDSYAFFGEVPEGLSRVARVVFSCIKTSIDRMNEDYEASAERNRENGKKGGRPRKPTETQQNPNNPVGFLGFSEKPTETDQNPQKAMKGNEMKGNESNSFRAIAREAADAEKEIFQEIFFWRNFKNPAGEAERFMSYNSEKGWKALNTPEKRRAAASESWTPNDGGPRVNEKFLSMWGALYGRIKGEFPHVARDMLHDGCRCTVANGVISIHAPESVRKYIDSRKPMEVTEWAKGAKVKTTWP